jgi:3-hydroxyacyl-CoA dehydrogenase/enoyl-CoA hydratase/3-hydroxybutyryl-CoA epimerase
MLNYSVDGDGIATLEFDYPGKSQNILNAASMTAFGEAIKLALDDPTVKGILLTSGKKDFVAGGDLAEMLANADAAHVAAGITAWHATARAMETGGKPVAAALNGSALGGGMELALFCHYRVAADNPKARFGFPEVTLGLLPGAGGTQRTPRLIGLQPSVPLLLEGKRLKVQEAHKAGLIQVVVPVGEERAAARAWLLGEGQSNAQQPWDKKSYKIPGGGVMTPAGMQFFTGANAMLREKTYGNYPAPKHILSCLFEGLQVDMDTGLKIETRYFASLVASAEAKNMIRSLFFGMQDANKLASRPAGVAVQTYTRIGMLGAGMMGAGIAMSTASAGIDVVLLDATQEAADKGKAYAVKQWTKQVERRRMTADQAATLAARIHPTADYADMKGCELVIEAVFERREIKAAVTARAEAVLLTNPASDAIFASNTSTLPITGLAAASARPANFIGLHFFSPAEKMPLVEIIVGKETSDATLARSMDFVKAIGKTPIVVNDARSFYTSRVFGTYVSEGMALLEEGYTPALIDKAGLISGMPVGPLALADEVSIELVHKIAQQTRADQGSAYVERAADRVAAKMVEGEQRLGRKSGGGFYDYPVDEPKRLWPGLAERFPQKVGAGETAQEVLQEIIDRLILVQSAETVRCLEEGVLRAPIDGDVGAILGWGYPAFRGGPIGWLHTLGLPQAVARLKQLAAAHGSRFAPPAKLIHMAGSGERFYPR